MPAISFAPIVPLGLISIRQWRPFFIRTISSEHPSFSLRWPTNCSGSLSFICLSFSNKASSFAWISIFEILDHNSFSNGARESRFDLEKDITRSPLPELKGPVGGMSPKTSEPYTASYKLFHRALTALIAYRALVTGTTNCGPDTIPISGSTPDVCILKSSFCSTR